MQVNRINSTSFGSGMLIVNPAGEGVGYEVDNPKCLFPENIKDIEQAGRCVNIKYENTDSTMCDIRLAKTVPMEKVLAAYTAAMVASEGTLIDIRGV